MHNSIAFLILWHWTLSLHVTSCRTGLQIICMLLIHVLISIFVLNPLFSSWIYPSGSWIIPGFSREPFKNRRFFNYVFFSKSCYEKFIFLGFLNYFFTDYCSFCPEISFRDFSRILNLIFLTHFVLKSCFKNYSGNLKDF